MKLTYSPDHPYYLSRESIFNAIDRYSRSDIIEAYKKLFDPRNARVIVAGNISEEEIKIAFEKLFSELKKHKSNSFEKVEQKTESLKSGEIVHINFNTPQTLISFSQPGVKSNTKDIFATLMANVILGSGSCSRLFEELRNKEGLVYYIGARLSELAMLSSICGDASCDPKNRDKLIEKIKDVFKEFAVNGITQDELNSCKISMAVSENLSSAQSIVSFLSTCRNRDISVSEVNEYMHNFYNLTFDEVNHLIKKIFDPDKLNFVTVGQDPNGGKND